MAAGQAHESEVRRVRADGSLGRNMSKPTFSRDELKLLKLWKRVHQLLGSAEPGKHVYWDTTRKVLQVHFMHPEDLAWFEVWIDQRTLEVKAVIQNFPGNERNSIHPENGLFTAIALIQGKDLNESRREEVVKLTQEA